MSGFDLDADSERKFWINIVKYISATIITVVLIFCLFYYLEDKRMLDAGYTYEPVYSRPHVIGHHWVKVDSLPEQNNTAKGQ